MKKTLCILSVILCIVFAANAQDFSDPRYAPWGDTPEERQQNALASNLLKETLDSKQYNEAAGYFRTLVENAPGASEATFIRGAELYSIKVQLAKTPEEKKVMLDSLMSIYDLRLQYFSNSKNYGRAYVLDRKAGAYMTHNPNDRKELLRLYETAVAAGHEDTYENLSEVALLYFKHVVDAYKADELTADQLLEQYERLAPVYVSEDATVVANGQQFDQLFAGSGLADCETVEQIYGDRIAANPDDVVLHKTVVSLLGRSQCNSPFFFRAAERYYVLDPSAETAMLLAQGFQAAGDYNKAITYLRETLAVEKDPAKRINLLRAIGLDELAAGRASNAAQAASEIRTIDPNDGMSYFIMAQAYAASASACGGFEGQAAFWVAYDTMSQAVGLLGNDPAAAKARQAAATYRNVFPTAEDLFFHELKEGQRYTVTCGMARGIATTVRAR